jgi:hypothetical protein
VENLLSCLILQLQSNFFPLRITSSFNSKFTIFSCGTITRQTVFNISTASYQLKGESSTIGLDAFISSERIIWLDCQPLLSAAVAERELSSIYSKYHKNIIAKYSFYTFFYVSQRHVQGITLKNGNFLMHWDYGRGPISPVAFLLILHLPCSSCCSRLFS